MAREPETSPTLGSSWQDEDLCSQLSIPEKPGICIIWGVPLLPAAATLLSTPEYQATPYFLQKNFVFLKRGPKKKTLQVASCGNGAQDMSKPTNKC